MRNDTICYLILRVDYYVCLSRYHRIGQCRFNLADTIKMAMFLRYVWTVFSRGLVRCTLRFSRITRGGEEPYTKPSVHVELEAHRRVTPFLRKLIFRGDIWLFECLTSATCRRYVCYTFRRARRRGDAFCRAVCRVR